MVEDVSIRTDENKKDFATEVARGEVAELLRMLVKVEGAKASFQILRPPQPCRLTFLRRPFPPKIIVRAAEEFDAPLESALSSIIAGAGVAKHDVEACKIKKRTGSAAPGPPSHPQGRGWLPKQRRYQGGGATWGAKHYAVLGRVVAVSVREELAELLQRLPDRPITAGRSTSPTKSHSWSRSPNWRRYVEPHRQLWGKVGTRGRKGSAT